ncbi:MAG: TPM domain-containing protein [Leptospiraceae bacterium]|nr:TPM domain-containing protein [Leptospiraceae bacterium]
MAAAFLLLALLGPASKSLESREAPRYTGRVNDYASRLSEDSELILEHISFRHEKKYGDRIILLTVDSLKDVDAEDFSRKVLESWKLAGPEAKKESVVLVLVAVLEKQVRIHTTEAAREFLHPNEASSILGKSVLPELKKGLYSVGLFLAFEEISGSMSAEHEKRKRRESGPEAESAEDPADSQKSSSQEPSAKPAADEKNEP